VGTDLQGSASVFLKTSGEELISAKLVAKGQVCYGWFSIKEYGPKAAEKMHATKLIVLLVRATRLL
jgi:hypothetical protein